MKVYKMLNTYSDKDGQEMISQGRYLEAIEFYHKFNGDDPSWDASFNANKIAICYEKLGMSYSACYYFGLAAENESIDNRNRLKYDFFQKSLNWKIE